MSSVRIFLVLVFVSFGLLSCGGGGGGGSFVGAAQVFITTSPRTFDTGDRTLVRVEISDVHRNGIALKLRYAATLSYVPDSAILTVDGDELDVSPTINADKDNKTYLVFYLPQDLFGSENSDLYGELTVQLEASRDIADGMIEVDADVDDPLIGNDTEFDIDTPEFVAEDDVGIEVIG